MTDAAEIFDRQARRYQRGRAAPGFASHAFLKDVMIDELCARIDENPLVPQRVLDIGAHDGRLGRRIGAAWTVALDPALAFARTCRAPTLVADEDRLPFADASFDLVVSTASLQAVNDLPGALIQIRRILRPGGLFLAAFFAGETLLNLRQSVIAVESEMTGRAAARVAPMVDIHGAAGLLQRAGFISPVADVDSYTVRYDDLAALLRDMRGMGEANVLASRQPLRREVLARVAADFSRRADSDGKISVPVQIVTMTGWVAK